MFGYFQDMADPSWFACDWIFLSSHLLLSWAQAQLIYREPQYVFIGSSEMLAELTAFNVTTDSKATERWLVCICGWFEGGFKH